MKLNEIVKRVIKESDYENIIGYHGTDSKFAQFNDNNPIFFVDNPTVAKTYGDIIIKAKLTLENPLELDFDGNSTIYFYNKWYVPSKLALFVKNIANDINRGYVIANDLEEELEYFGFKSVWGDMDGIIMKNIKDVGKYDTNGMFSKLPAATNYVVFNKNQIQII